MKLQSIYLATILASGFALFGIRNPSYAEVLHDASYKTTHTNKAEDVDSNKAIYSKDTVYVSITGLKLKNTISVFTFYRHAIPSLNQAKKAEGNISADVNKINGVYHTLSVWESEEKMREFLYTGAHLKAIQAFPTIGVGKTFGYTTKTVPSWDEIHTLWLEHSINYDAN